MKYRIKSVYKPTTIVVFLFLLSIMSCGMDPFYEDELTILSGEEEQEPSELEQKSGDSFEDDDTLNESTRIPLGTIQSHSIYPESDIDCLQFPVTSGKTYRIAFTDISGFEPEVTVYRENRSDIIVMKNTGTHSSPYDWWGYNTLQEYKDSEKEALIFQAPADEMVFFSVKDIYDSHDAGLYKVSVQEYYELGAAGNLTCTPETEGIYLEWDSVENALGYYLFRTTSQIDTSDPDYNQFALIEDITAGTNAYTDAEVEVNTLYSYYIQAYRADITGENSNIAQCEIIFTVPKITDLTAAAATNNNFQIDLAWSALDSADSYTIFRTAEPQNGSDPDYSAFSELTQLPGNAVSFTDGTIDANIQYYYYITGTIDSTESDPSNIAEASFSWSDFKSSKDIIDASQGIPGRITITFEEKYDHPEIIRYDVYRSADEVNPDYEGPVCSFSADDALGSTFNDTIVIPGEYYFYCVKIILLSNGTELESDYSWFDSGIAD